MNQFAIAASQVERKSQDGKKDGKVSYIIKLFSDGPKQYGFLLKILSLGRDNYWRASVVKEARVGRGIVLDIACGTGLLTYQFARQGAKVVGVDVTKEMLLEARKKEGQYKQSVDLVQARAENLPFKSGVFDGATISLAMRNVSSQRETLGEMRRCTKKGGKVISLDFARPKSSFFKPFYYFYIFRLLPAIGLVISRHWNVIFLYLANSIEKARDPEQLSKTMEKVGLDKAKVRRMTHGTTALVSGVS